MADKPNPIRWARRLKPHLLRRLYETDAKGIVDEDLINEVGYGLLARCESIQRVTERLCPECGGEMDGVRESSVRERSISCNECGWKSTWAAYHKSYKPDRLHGGRAYPCFLEFLEEFPRCRTPQTKMLAIDRLVHAVHEWSRKTWTIPAAVNLIEAKREEVTALLDDLAYGDILLAERQAIRETYRNKLAESVEPTQEHFDQVRRRREKN